ncbi:hypothetical protein TWF481_008070 [Arthrobotrys musiformis]|uniref:Uncharacterized protein n=1 Tax=Arthrobotrys musiformis TaxID=47236 RepID=A0AAV9W8K8_9PEZI
MCSYDLHHFLHCDHKFFSNHPASLCKLAKKRASPSPSEDQEEGKAKADLQMPCIDIKRRSKNAMVRIPDICTNCQSVRVPVARPVRPPTPPAVDVPLTTPPKLKLITSSGNTSARSRKCRILPSTGGVEVTESRRVKKGEAAPEPSSAGPSQATDHKPKRRKVGDTKP